MAVRKLRMTVAYDGTDFCGFQRQPDRPTVQGELERALQVVTGENITITGAGRTDTGVHALGQVVHFNTGWPGPVEKLPVILYSRLPGAIAVLNAIEVLDEFHARYGARFRRYGYQFLVSSRRDPLQERFALRVDDLAGLDAMMCASRRLLGRHDFSGFMSDAGRGGQERTERLVQRVRWKRLGIRVVFLIQADGFLRHMVRNIVGALLEVGAGIRSEARFEALLVHGRLGQSIQPAPASGLCLLRVGYR